MTTIAATMNGVRPVEAIGLGAHEPAARGRAHRLSRGQAAAVAMSIALGVVVAGYGLAGSYLSVADLADRHHVPLAELVPAGIDGGLVAVVVLDLVLTWIGKQTITALTGALSLECPKPVGTASRRSTLRMASLGHHHNQILGSHDQGIPRTARQPAQNG